MDALLYTVQGKVKALFARKASYPLHSTVTIGHIKSVAMEDEEDEEYEDDLMKWLSLSVLLLYISGVFYLL